MQKGLAFQGKYAIFLNVYGVCVKHEVYLSQFVMAAAGGVDPDFGRVDIWRLVPPEMFE